MSGGSNIAQRTARPWLPPLSIATILGVLLFCVYIGSALYSSLDDMFFKTRKGTEDIPAYSVEEEARYCQPFEGVMPEKTIYVQPSGSIAQRLGALATSKHIASTLGANHVMVWNGREERKSVFTEDWNDVFQYPDLKGMSAGCYPGGARSHHRAQCTIMEVHTQEAWQELLLSQSKQGATWPLCVRSSISLGQEHGADAMVDADFLRTLKPAQGIINHVYHLKQRVNWDDWGYWVGIDLDTYDEHVVEKVLRQFGNIMREQNNPESIRVVFMIEDMDTETALRNKLVSLYADLDAAGRLVSGNSAIAQRPGDCVRSDLAKILLQSYCKVVITHDTLDECETAAYLGVDSCIAV